MKLVIAGTGASGAIYLQRLLAQIDCSRNEIHLVLSSFAKQVIHDELDELLVPEAVHQHNDRSMNVPFASGSTYFDAMVIVPCTMGTMTMEIGRAHVCTPVTRTSRIPSSARQ